MTTTTGTRAGQSTLAGQCVSPGVAVGPVSFSLGGLEGAEQQRRLRDDEVEAEFTRLDSVARAARVSLVRQREALADHFTGEQRKVFDTHLLMLEDPVIEADVRERIAKQRMTAEDAVKDVLHVYERLFEVVESESLRNKISDMRDVALRMLRHCKRPTEAAHRQQDLRGSVMVVRELTLSDLTEALEHGVAAIVAEGGSQTSHGAILTRAAALPAVIGLAGITSVVTAGDRLLVDGDSGQVIVNPTPETVSAAQNQAEAEAGARLSQTILAEGGPVRLLAAAASPSEARAAAHLGISAIGLYRTELPLIQRHGAPRETSLAALYRQVVNAASQVVFRLPDLDATVELRDAVLAAAELNPALGLRGCRLLFAYPEILRAQLRAILRAAEGKPVRIAVPFVCDETDLARCQEALDLVREELRLAGADVSRPAELGPVIETPAAALLARELFQKVRFALIGVDSLAQQLLAAERGHAHPEVSARLRAPHPVLLRAVRKLVQLGETLETELIFYGESLDEPAFLEALVAAGAAQLAVRPTLLRETHERLEELLRGRGPD